MFSKEIADNLIKGSIGVIPTDTVYGIVGRAEIPETVERIYKVRYRNINKPCIVLISSFNDLEKFNIKISSKIKEYIENKKIWPGEVSIVFPVLDEKFDYVSRGTKSVAFRVPNFPELLDLISKTGPLIAPSSNIEGEPTAKNIEEACSYFKNAIDFYVDGGELNGPPSTLIKFENEEPIVLRQGKVKID